MGNRHDIAVRDVVKVPSDLKPGPYVLGFRYDCEATAQVSWWYMYYFKRKDKKQVNLLCMGYK